MYVTGSSHLAIFSSNLFGRLCNPPTCHANRNHGFRHIRSSSRPFECSAIHASQRILPLERPPDPSSFSSPIDNNDVTPDYDVMGTGYVQNQTRILREWMRNKQSIICITGAGMSTESGIPDYRGNKGSYFRGHKPIIHHEFMTSSSQRKRYWARSLVGYSPFANARPNSGHKALAELETRGLIGVDLDECTNFDRLGFSCFGHFLDEIDGKDVAARKLSVITQNVDILHSKAGVKNCLHLHGRGDLIRCMNCGFTRDRKDYHDELARLNSDWLNEATSSVDGIGDGSKDGSVELRPDGDAELHPGVSYDEFILPSCSRCGNAKLEEDLQQEQRSFFKTDVVFFGDSVPKHRFDISHAAIDAADGVLCIGTSLTVHSAYRLVKRAIEREIPVAILNVGQTRVEREGLGNGGLVTKLESPIGETLNGLVEIFDREKS
ncbi:hypothetical protein ACHAW5_009232 [Stephanodiscus triporus]|uniref:Deacetylase sirtuin-type domain-containing protein n=1 Tax=Stephanodiscus triporus TaxID=2934178 RepID=A0ABD3PGI5_9STRA